MISIGKFGSFPANLLLGRPFYTTFEIHEDKDSVRLRLVPASELNAEVLAEDESPAESRAEPAEGADGAAFDIVTEDGAVLMKNNRLTVDDASRQTLTMQEIEELKKSGTGSGKEIIEKILASHTGLDEKTKFSLAKYMLRKTRKYLKRFTVLPMDVSMLTEYMLTEKEASRIMELREESLGLIGSWANVHYGDAHGDAEDGLSKVGSGRWLVVDETGGLVVAALAERMGILYPEADEDEDDSSASQDEAEVAANDDHEQGEPMEVEPQTEEGAVKEDDTEANANDKQDRPNKPSRTARHSGTPASSNTLHLLHANAQPNLSLLKYFSYDTNNPTPSHPLHTHLQPLSWLQLLDPDADATYAEPATVPASELSTWKSGKRGTYFKKRRRWERCKTIVDTARAGGFDGLVIASAMAPDTILKHLVPLLKGAGHVVVYSPTIEPLAQLADLYSKERKAAYLAHLDRGESIPEDDFPVDPRLLLAPSLQTSRVRSWQVLPQRTHPLMTSRGGAEGYVFTARRVLPVEGKVEARGKFSKKRKVA